MVKRKHDNWNGPIMVVGFAIYGGLLILFGWQTWQFVNFLFPDDQLLMKVLTFISFDFMALVWAVVHTFYRFASRNAKKWVIVSWVLTFILSLVASILYLVVESFFRFQIAISTDMVNTGYAISLCALVFNVLALMSWLVLEYRARHPRQDEFDLYEQGIDEDDEDEGLPPAPVQPTRVTTGGTNTAQAGRMKAAYNALRRKGVPNPPPPPQGGPVPEIDYDKLAAALDARKQQPEQQLSAPAASPLQHPHLTSQAHQVGATNGN